MEVWSTDQLPALGAAAAAAVTWRIANMARARKFLIFPETFRTVTKLLLGVYYRISRLNYLASKNRDVSPPSEQESRRLAIQRTKIKTHRSFDSDCGVTTHPGMFAEKQSGEAAAEGTTRSLGTVEPGYRKQKRQQQKEFVNNLDAVRSPKKRKCAWSPRRLANRALPNSPRQNARALSLTRSPALLRAHSL
jgi:hypothetical protein